MLEWLSDNAGTLLISLLLILMVAAILRSMIKARKKGSSPCGCGAGSACAGCAGCCSACQPAAPGEKSSAKAFPLGNEEKASSEAIKRR